jgi:hypothetical protein
MLRELLTHLFFLNNYTVDFSNKQSKYVNDGILGIRTFNAEGYNVSLPRIS